MNDIINFFKNLNSGQKILLSEVITLGKILFVLPATNATSERSFSALKRVKTYLRSSTSDRRLNHLLTMHIDQERCDELDLVKVANVFIKKAPRREEMFGKFSKVDLQIKNKIIHSGTQT